MLWFRCGQIGAEKWFELEEGKVFSTVACLCEAIANTWAWDNTICRDQGSSVETCVLLSGLLHVSETSSRCGGRRDSERGRFALKRKGGVLWVRITDGGGTFKGSVISSDVLLKPASTVFIV